MHAADSPTETGRGDGRCPGRQVLLAVTSVLTDQLHMLAQEF